MPKMRVLRFLVLTFTVIFINIHPLYAQDKDNSKKNLWTVVTEGKIIKHIRSYFMRRHFDEPKTQQSEATGGWLGYETAPWYGLSAVVIGYTSQGLGLNNEKYSGAGLLGLDQEAVTVLGQAYAKYENEKILIKLYRQSIDTLFINSNDYRMIPYLYEAYTFETKIIKNFDIYLSHAAKVKGWTDSKFRSMSEFAGIPDSDEGVTFAGAVFTPKDSLKIQAWNYYCYEFMNVVCGQADYTLNLLKQLNLQVSIQGFHQEDTGESLYGKFHTNLGGIRAIFNWHGFKPKIGFTITDKSHDVVNPWSSWFGFTSIIEEDCDLAGEKAWILGLAYDFEKIGIKGLSAFIDHTEAYVPPGGWFSSTDQTETNLTIDYAFGGKLNGLALRLRAATVNNSFDTHLEDYNDFRIIVNYDF